MDRSGDNLQPLTSDTRTHDLAWILTDAVDLIRLRKHSSAMLLLLCTVDALAGRKLPEKKVGERFEEFLRGKMRRPGRPQVWNIMIPPTGELLPLEQILYKYLRNPVVHEGARLELDHPKRYAVQIDWDQLSRGLKVDSDHSRVIIGGELILDILIDAVNEGLRDDSPTL